MEFGILGPLEVRSASGEVPIRRGLPRTILIALVLRRGQTVSSDFLVDLLWGDELPRNPANALQIQVSYLRKTLGGAEPGGSTLLETRAGGYALLVEPEQIDAHRFEAAVTDVHTADGPRYRGGAAPARWTRSSARWRCGGATRSRTSPAWSSPVARSPGSRSCAGWRRNAGSTCSCGWAATATRSATCRSWSRRMPLRERFHEQLVLALYRSGRQARRAAGLRGRPADAGRGARDRARRGPA